jgi:hypothetical protein
MGNLEPQKIHIPFGKVAAFVAKFIAKAKGGFTKEEGEEILADFILLLSGVLEDNIKK